jgi:hypothetical protein
MSGFETCGGIRRRNEYSSSKCFDAARNASSFCALEGSMSSTPRISGRVIAAARTLAGIGEADFAAAAGLPLESLRGMEAGGSAYLRTERDVEAVRRGLEHFGLIVLEESDGMGAGVRLKFTRQETKQIGRLENEGGIIGSDDAP